MSRVQFVSWVLAGVCAWGCAVAAEALPPSLRACMSESEASQRLACFDRESARLVQQSAPTARKSDLPPPAPVAAAPSTPSAAAPPAASAAAPSAPSVAAPSAAAATAAAAPAASAPAQSAQDKFGYRGNLARGDLDKQQEEERRAAEQLTAKVTALSTLPHGEALLTLDNGQMWQQKPGDRGMRVKVGDEVTIKRGSLGSFLLTSQAKGSMRVSRVK